MNSLWYTFYVQTEPSTERQKNYFRKRFRLTYEAYTELLLHMKQHPMFRKKNITNCSGEASVPLELLLLGFLRYAGCGFTLDDLEEVTAISRETHRRFILQFIEYGLSCLWEQYIIKTATMADGDYNSQLFPVARFSGCIGSVDGTHVVIERCSDWAINKYKGYKLNKPSHNYNNVACNHMREFLSCTKEFPATWNDKTTI